MVIVDRDRQADPPTTSNSSEAKLSRFERIALSLGHWINESETPKALQTFYHRSIGRRWVRQCVKNLLHIEGLEHVRSLNPDRGVLLCANHRSFFDQYVLAMALVDHAPWVREFYFPVRATFFYETWAGLAVNMVIGGGVMYPPIFRDRERAQLNREALDRMARFLDRKGALVGIHPEGTRGKGSDPYELLPAQPGVGQVALRSNATIIPAWINGLSNDVVAQVTSNYRRDGERIIIVFGPPVTLGALAEGNPRPALYKRVADRILDDIRILGHRERAIRESLKTG